eukprot:CAMPEP_0180401894 /NCGR_PEP_ID=MMETSP0989-20121125/38547_1 /TAXON_ID=697907 /ORGANISM="non described non described, Strain CCMP2293" /LENGTH=50 /DNA_ID=CAMNT_0022404917 /DNA_START=51 /DNA_END=200 /DNA_ORIENTATION=+
MALKTGAPACYDALEDQRGMEVSDPSLGPEASPQYRGTSPTRNCPLPRTT